MKLPLTKRPTLRLSRPLEERLVAPAASPRSTDHPLPRLRLDPARVAAVRPQRQDPDSQAILDELGRLGLADPD